MPLPLRDVEFSEELVGWCKPRVGVNGQLCAATCRGEEPLCVQHLRLEGERRSMRRLGAQQRLAELERGVETAQRLLLFGLRDFTLMPLRKHVGTVPVMRRRDTVAWNPRPLIRGLAAVLTVLKVPWMCC